MGSVWTFVLAFVMVMVPSSGPVGQGAVPVPTDYAGPILNTWKALHDKLLTMAKDWPEDRYGWRPHPDSRSMVEEFRHITIGLEMSTAQVLDEPFDYGARVAADRTKLPSRDSVVSEMELAVAASYRAVATHPSPALVFWIGHQSEHYGKLVSNYRINGIVPPISRSEGGS